MAAEDYTDLTTIKDELKISDTNDDGRLSRAITDASRVIDRLCHRPDGDFGTQTLTRYFDVVTPRAPDNDEQLWLAQRLAVPPLVSITTLATDEDGDLTYETVWTANTDYFLYPLNTPPYREIVVNPVLGRYAFPVGLRRVSIAGSWADASAIPGPIRRATLIQAIRLYKRSDSPLGVMGSVDTGFVKVPQGDPDVRQILIDGGYIEQWIMV